MQRDAKIWIDYGLSVEEILLSEKGCGMDDLAIRREGSRHVVSRTRNGQREDLGQLPEATLRSYVACLPGSYRAPDDRTAGLSTKGADRRQFTQAVETRKAELLRTNPGLGELEAFRRASSEVSQENPALLARYRADARRV